MFKRAHLPDRAVLSVSGPDRHSFLQGLVSNDVATVPPGQAVWSALLTPQGKWLADFFVVADADRLLLDCEAAQAPMLAQKLSRFRLRARVAVEPVPLHVSVGWDGDPEPAAGTIAARDPRLAAAGWRLVSEAPLEDLEASEADWDRHRLLLGLPDGSRDLEAEKSLLLEAGFDELNGVSWSKGCYMGQELTARTRYRGLLKRRLVPVTGADGTLPVPGTALLTMDGLDAGTMRSSRDGLGLATVKLDRLRQPLTAEGLAVTVRVPDWMRLPEAAEAS
ncbi:YgfZ/GcvT domain-containing protein [Rhizosaccharibacter radicis]|uniref:Folate-binding protein n=1 Tax=Rhizosaccharibacter radicis TaxID=2782605 RepID=A0ABT1W0Z8_9PROT|nr:folate-binding protein [Acetobacteraceae bacterium KSS12]